MKLTWKNWKNIEHNLMRGIMIVSIAASTTLMSCGSNGGADGIGSGANNDSEVEDNASGGGMEAKEENRNGIGTQNDMQMSNDTTSNIDEGGVSSQGSGSGVDDRMGTEKSGTGNTGTNTDMDSGDMNTGNVDSGTGKGTATGSDNSSKSRIESTKKGSGSGPGAGNQQ